MDRDNEVGFRPKTPDTMLELCCRICSGDELAVGDMDSSSGFDEEGYMFFGVSNPYAPLGNVKLDRGQVEQLRDFLNEKLARS